MLVSMHVRVMIYKMEKKKNGKTSLVLLYEILLMKIIFIRKEVYSKSTTSKLIISDSKLIGIIYDSSSHKILYFYIIKFF